MIKMSFIRHLVIALFFSATQLAGKTAYDFSFEALHSKKPLPLSPFKGQVILVVNTASNCGFTPQYKGLETLYKTYKNRGLVIIGVPSNDFGSQEPGTSTEIGAFCERNYGVTFPLTEKTHVSGKQAHPFYGWIRETLGFKATPKWNFHKILISRSGTPIDFFLSTTSPDSKTLINAIEKELAKP